MPSAHHALQEPPTSLTDQRSPPVRPGDVCVGCIVWLPPKGTQEGSVLCNRHSCCNGAALNNKGYNHPVVVLRIQQTANSRNPGDLVCTVACATSFDETPFSIYQERRLQRLDYQESIPILDSTSSTFRDDSQTLKHLVLEKGRLRKQSYVRLDHTYEVPVAMLTQFHKGRCRAYKLRLSEGSYRLMSAEFGIVPEIYEETNTLFETEARRLAALACPFGLAQNTTLLRPSIRVAPRIVFPPASQPLLHQSNSVHIWQPTPPIVRYDSTSFIQSQQHLPHPYSDRLPYSNPPEPSDADATSSVFKWIIGTVIVGSLVWWRYSVYSR